MTEAPDPLNEALREATLAVLLGSTEVTRQYVDESGMMTTGTFTIESAFVTRLQQKARDGDFDEIIEGAMEYVSETSIAKAVESYIASQIEAGLRYEPWSYKQEEPGWMQRRAKDIATEAVTKALSSDEELIDRLRTMIGAEVDRNRVAINVALSNPEA